VNDLSAFSLEGRTIMVTGANTGIGQGIAVSLARAGASVVGVGRSSMDATQSLVSQAGGSFTGEHCDFADDEQTRNLISAVWDRHGMLDGVVNNAGIIRRSDSIDFSEQDWDDVLQVNLKAPWLICQSFARRLFAEARTGRIVNIASLLSFQGGIRVPSYTASKHGIEGLTKILANEWAARGINVNAIAPGYIATNNTGALRADPDRSRQILERIPAGRWGDPADIGDTAVFLMAPASAYIHGTTIAVDGGWLAR
jgi:2-deoxy-D-gluconate 3-dehydrogenase